MQVYLPPKPAPLPADFEESCIMTEKEKELIIATEKLGSSYFIQWTHMYRDWSKAQADKKAKAEAAKAEAAKAEADKALVKAEQ